MEEAQKQDWKDIDVGDDSKTLEVKEEKPAIVSKTGSKVTNKQTIRKAKQNAKKIKELAKPLDDKEVKYEIQSNLKMDGKDYVKGDTFLSKLSKQIERLIEINVIKAI